MTIKGSLGIMPRQKLVKKRGCSKLCFMRASKEVFHIQGPFLGNLEILTVEVRVGDISWLLFRPLKLGPCLD